MNLEIRRLRESDDRRALDCGDAALNTFFARCAGQNQFRYRISATYIAADATLLLGFSTVSPGVLDEDDRESLATKLPRYPVPVLRLCRLGTSVAAQGTGVGTKLVRQCFKLAVAMAEDLGCAGVLVDAYPAAQGFYGRFGFAVLRPSTPTGAIPMFLPIATIEKVVNATNSAPPSQDPG